MARNGSGTYSVPNTFVSGTSITASAHNQNWDDIEAEMTNSVAADGQTTMSGALKAANGSAAAPSYTFGADINTGAYRRGADEYGISTAGTAAGYWDSAQKFWQLGAANFAGAVTINGTLTVGAFSVTTLTITTSITLPAGAIDADDLASNSVTTAKITDSNVTTAKIADDNVTHAKAADGFVTKVEGTAPATSNNLNGITPIDDTIPQITEGAELVSDSIVVDDATSKVMILFSGFLTCSNATTIAIALHRTGAADAIQVMSVTVTVGPFFPVSLFYIDTPGSAAEHTYSIRVGTSGGSDVRFFGSTSGGRFFGGAAKAPLILAQIKA